MFEAHASIGTSLMCGVKMQAQGRDTWRYMCLLCAPEQMAEKCVVRMLDWMPDTKMLEVVRCTPTAPNSASLQKR